MDSRQPLPAPAPPPDRARAGLTRVVRIVTTATRPFGPVALAGLLAGAAVLAALAPWLLTSDEGSSAWWTLVAGALVAPARLLWHRRRLRRGIGDPARVLNEVGDTLRPLGQLPA